MPGIAQHIATDTLRLDTAYINVWRQNENFDYDREVMNPTKNLLESFIEGLNNLLREITPRNMPDGTQDFINVVCAIALVVLLVWFFFKLKPKLFAQKDEADKRFSLEEDNIYGIDFEQMIEEARQKQNYHQMVRLIYLQTLRHLSDNKHIKWQPYKTPTQYTQEFPVAPFREMTQHFLLIRYGNGTATATMCDEMEQLQKSILRHIEEKKTTTTATTPTQTDAQATTEEKGGEA
ncbi:MAG: DUF4129 domain-containing protein [Prevotella sp.]|nr:DUF4129 domain-containing protein [Prevotella sp.]